MTREEATRILDAVIPPPEHHAVDLDHLQIAQAWAYVKETLTVEPQRSYEQGVKDMLDKYDEDFRVASEVRIAVGCKTAKECWELARNGDIRVVKHGRWNDDNTCSRCGKEPLTEFDVRIMNYCPNCGADMRGGENG